MLPFVFEASKKRDELKRRNIRQLGESNVMLQDADFCHKTHNKSNGKTKTLCNQIRKHDQFQDNQYKLYKR